MSTPAPGSAASVTVATNGLPSVPVPANQAVRSAMPSAVTALAWNAPAVSDPRTDVPSPATEKEIGMPFAAVTSPVTFPAEFTTVSLPLAVAAR